MIIPARRTISSVLQEKLLAKFSRQYHAPTKITFAGNKHKFDTHTTPALYILNDWLHKICRPKACNFIKKRLQHRCFIVNIAKFSSQNTASAFTTIFQGMYPDNSQIQW